MSQSDPPADEPGADTATQEHPPDPPARPRRVTKRKDDEVIDGVCSGIGDYFGIDPVLVRLGFVAAVFAGGAGIIAYIVCMVVIPEDPGDGAAPPPKQASDRSPQFWVGIGLIVVAVALLAGRFDLFDGGIFWPLVLIGIGVALWRTSDRDGSAPPPGPTDAVAPSGPPDAVPADPATHLTAPTAASPAPPARTPTASGAPLSPDAPPPRGRSSVGRVTLAVALVTTGALVGISGTGALAISVPETLAVALVVVGGGLLVAARWGRARGLLPVGVLLLLAVLASGYATRLEVPLAAGVGERVERPGSVAELEDAYELSVGHLVVDLTALDLDDDTVATEVRLGVGQIEVWVPDDVDVVVDARTGAGQVELFGREVVAGVSVDHRLEDAGEGATLELDLSTGLGQIVVERDRDPDLGLDAPWPAAIDRSGAGGWHAVQTPMETRR